MVTSERRRALLLSLLAGSSGAACIAATAPVAPSDPLLRPAPLAPRAVTALLLDVALAGERVVAVGERGTVLLSDDAGRQWRQVACPVSATLTALCFATPRLGWAVGHGGVVLHTIDAGSTWLRQLDGRQAAQIELAAATSAKAAAQAARLKRAQQWVEDGADKPWLDVHFEADGRHGLVVGAYGMALATDDGGATWRSVIDRLDNPKGLHLNTIRAQGSNLWLAGEQGLLMRSTDGARSFVRLASPYEGSWFALATLGENTVVAAGLRGNVWHSQDSGASFAKSQVPMPVSVIAAARGVQGELLLLNQAGMLLASSDEGRSFRPVPVPPGPPATALLALPDGALVVGTMAGAARWPRPAGPAKTP